MASVSVRIDGLNLLGERMRKLSEKVNKEIAFKATIKAARLIRKYAKENIVKNDSIETGALLNSIVVKRLTKTRNTAEYVVAPSTASMKRYVAKSRAKRHRIEGKQTYEDLGDFFYARFIEYGTVNAPARPFLRPALEEHRDEAAAVMIETLKQGIEKAGA